MNQEFFYRGKPYNKHNFNDYFLDLCRAGNIEKIEEIIEDDMISLCDLNRGLLSCCKRDNLKIIDFLLFSPKLKNHADIYYKELSLKIDGVEIYDTPFLSAVICEKNNVIDYLLYDLEYDVIENTKNYLNYRGRVDILERIDKRDLYLNINQNLELKNSNSKPFKL